MQMNEAQANIAKLPPLCATYLASDGSPIMIKAGVMGYYPAPPTLDAKAFNDERGITKAQVNAMMNGSAFGWEIPAADADNEFNQKGDPYYFKAKA